LGYEHRTHVPGFGGKNPGGRARVSFFWPIVGAQDYGKAAPLHECHGGLTRTLKHVRGGTTAYPELAPYLVETTAVVCGIESDRRKGPPICANICGITPLSHDENGIETALIYMETGIRKIKVGSQLMEVLEIKRKWISIMIYELMEEWQEYDLVFPARTGKPLSQSYLIKRFKKLLKEAKLPQIRFHDLRHTAASLMLNSGVPVLVVSKRLGHAKPSITLDVYGHMISSMQEQAAEVMDQFIIPLEIQSPSPIAPELHRKIDSENLDKK
jgi:hypothetical protein